MTPEEWDASVAAAPNPHLLQSWRWGELQSRFAFKLDTEGRGEVCRWLTLCEAKV